MIQPSPATLPTYSRLPGRLVVLALLAIVLVGGFLRLVWGEDMEYKFDERYMYERAQRVGVDESWPLLGMYSGPGFRNPPLSVWTFIAAGKLAHVETPLGLARVVQAMNVAAMLVLACFIALEVPMGERSVWLWGAALAAVNPFTVILQRKIWAQSIVTLFCVVTLWGWWKRDRRWGAFIWGLVGACLGQIHMTGLFLTPALALTTALAGPAARRGWIREQPRPVRWKAWFAGSVLGALPILPWVAYMAWITFIEPDGRIGNLFEDMHVFNLTVWDHILNTSLGLRLSDVLGAEHWAEFQRYPLLGGFSHLVGAVHHLLRVLAGTIVLWVAIAALRALFAKGRRWPTGSDTDLLLFAGCVVYGVLLAAYGDSISWHYVAILFPLPFVLLARIMLSWSRIGRWALGVLLVSQLLLSLAFLQYIHLNGGAPGGDYGVAYSHQSAVSE